MNEDKNMDNNNLKDEEDFTLTRRKIKIYGGGAELYMAQSQPWWPQPCFPYSVNFSSLENCNNTWVPVDYEGSEGSEGRKMISD